MAIQFNIKISEGKINSTVSENDYVKANKVYKTHSVPTVKIESTALHTKCLNCKLDITLLKDLPDILFNKYYEVIYLTCNDVLIKNIIE
jgi:hypothetical protein